ncbi:hypothetical protein DSO57_1036551 [Entomophthora muscae]|uniref:Uncharacterized protein n=1 Tax=Entomophthora muscae TaxID=34485 RepID=A0ACC2SN95_9FUNG|nr:hypothetical protein DSO57_1036551 [Entomophthora muscae]
MKEIPTSPPLPTTPPTQDFSKLGFVYITVLGLANQVVPHTESWRPLATALNYLVHIAPIVYMAFRPSLPLLWESTWTLVWAVTTQVGGWQKVGSGEQAGCQSSACSLAGGRLEPGEQVGDWQEACWWQAGRWEAGRHLPG